MQDFSVFCSLMLPLFFHFILAELMKPKKTVKKVAEGTSEYQAAWILDSDGSEISGDETDEDDEQGEDMEPASASDEESYMDEDMEDVVCNNIRSYK